MPYIAVSQDWTAGWLILHVIMVGIAVALLFSKNLRPIKLGRRLDLAFGYLGLSWLNLAVFNIMKTYTTPAQGTMWMQTPMKLFVGFVKWYPPNLIDESSLLALGLGVAIALIYVWLRWLHAGMTERIFI